MSDVHQSKLDVIRDELTLIRVKLFGNGHKNGSLDHRLEIVEDGMKAVQTALPEIMTKAECAAFHESKRGSGRWVVEQLNKAVPWVITLFALIYAITQGGGK